uniref:(northern house mosquito) hypothetical protein n=1 Tax=Culex pipiens TaxID=7175 RepID=A0A8D8AUW9_CULPI
MSLGRIVDGNQFLHDKQTRTQVACQRFFLGKPINSPRFRLQATNLNAIPVKHVHGQLAGIALRRSATGPVDQRPNVVSLQSPRPPLAVVVQVVPPRPGGVKRRTPRWASPGRI